MDFDYQKCLQNCKLQIELEMSSNEVIKNTKMKEIINSDKCLKKIEDQKTSTEKNELIFKAVLDGGLASYRIFKTILQETRHFKLLDVLTRKEISITEEESDLWPRIASKSLIQCINVIQEDLDPKLTLDRFFVNGFTDRTNIRDMREQTTSTQKNNLIFSEVEKQGIFGYETLKKVLKETNQTGVLESLQDAERDATSELVKTCDILDDFICYRLAKSEKQSNIPHRHKSNANLQVFKEVRELATKFQERFDSSFSTGLINKLEGDLVQDILNILFKDGINWYRIVGAISFIGAMGVILKSKGMSKDEVLEKSSGYLETHIGQWIIDKGGWGAIIDFSKKNTKDGDDESDPVPVPAQIIVNNSGDADGERPAKVRKTHNNPATVETDNTATFAQLLLSVAGAFLLGVAVAKVK